MVMKILIDVYFLLSEDNRNRTRNNVGEGTVYIRYYSLPQKTINAFNKKKITNMKTYIYEKNRWALDKPVASLSA